MIAKTIEKYGILRIKTVFFLHSLYKIFTFILQKIDRNIHIFLILSKFNSLNKKNRDKTNSMRGKLGAR
mgnify:CR=1 FL=1